MRKVLITGGAGFIGSHLAEHFCAAGDTRVVVLDSLRGGNVSRLTGLDLEIVEGCVTDGELVARAAEGAQYIFHLAALVSVPESMQKPHLCISYNVNGTLNVLEAARRHGAQKVVFSSSAAVYGDEPTLPKRETMAPHPKSPYGITKLDGELYLEMYRHEHGVATASLRYFNVYGPRQDPGSQYAAAVPVFIDRAVHGQELTVFGDGHQTRDFIYVKDVVAANVFVATREDCQGVYNVARGESTSVLELAQAIVRQVGSPSRIGHGDERPGDIRHSQADVSRLREAGFVAGTSLERGLAATIESLAVGAASRP